MSKWRSVKHGSGGPAYPLLVATWLGECMPLTGTVYSQDSYAFAGTSRVTFRKDLWSNTSCPGEPDAALTSEYCAALGTEDVSIIVDGEETDAREIDYTAVSSEAVARTGDGVTALTDLLTGTWEVDVPQSIAGASVMGTIIAFNNGAAYYSHVYIDSSVDPDRLYTTFNISDADGNDTDTREGSGFSSTDNSFVRQ